jgi:hypothetical protein
MRNVVGVDRGRKLLRFAIPSEAVGVRFGVAQRFTAAISHHFDLGL